MKKCPFCAEEIQDEAIKCRHCGEMLNVDKAGPPVQPKKSGRPSIGFIATLCVLLIGVPLWAGMQRSKEQAVRRARVLRACQQNCKNLAVGLEMYASDNGGHYPATGNLQVLITGGYLNNIPGCPTGDGDYSSTYKATESPDHFRINCTADHSPEVLEGFPQYDSDEGLEPKM